MSGGDTLGMWVNSHPWSSMVEVLIDRTEYPADGPKARWDGVFNPAERTITFHDSPIGNVRESRSFCITKETAQSVLDSLWRSGFRPNGGRDAEGVHEAQREHIADLRKVLDVHVRGKAAS